MQEVTVKEKLPNAEIPLIDEDETVVMGKHLLAQTATILDQWCDETTAKSGAFATLTVWQSIVHGIVQALPIVIGFVPLAFAYGVMAQEANLSLLATILMSIIVFAGASQFVAVNLMLHGQSFLAIVFTTFVINLRHLLFSTSISQSLSRWPLWQRLLFSTQLTDESFALHNVWFSEHRASYPRAQAINATAHIAWIFGSYLGHMTGSVFADIRVFGLDYALAAMFIGILVYQIRNYLMGVIALFTGLLCIVFTKIGLGNWSVISAAVTGATLGMLFDIWNQRRTS